ncbi:helix-turn-helix domain-containing protein [Acidibrevibacterium fodinaquatile]|uniref:helix-turn-helix domain-containing protein n=1 Tax=Acidibrevibacterium fodinaquatile TaxID=1969806 RepID=UPI0013B3A896
MASRDGRKDETDRAVRLRLKWIAAYEEVRDAGAVCRRFGVSRPTLRKWLRRYEAEGEAGLVEQSRRPHRSPTRKVGQVQEAVIVRLRRERRLGVKRLRIELERLHGLRLAASTIHKVLTRLNLSALPRKRRPRHVPKRYSRPVPGDRVHFALFLPFFLPLSPQFLLSTFPSGIPGTCSRHPIPARHHPGQP